MKQFLVIFGTTPRLSLEELRSVTNRFHFFTTIEPFAQGCARVIAKDSFEADTFINRMGGIVKIGEIIGTLARISPGKLFPLLIRDIPTKEKFVFGLSTYSPLEGVSIEELARELKVLCREKDIKSRFVLPRESSTLGSVVVVKQHIHELLLIQKDTRWYVAKTLAVQDFQAWGKRDFGRPYADPKHGMLPPKVARMMVNIALCEAVEAHPILLDPFCGMGTILSESLMLGVSACGSDIAHLTVEKAIHNLNWLKITFGLTKCEFELKTAEATHVADVFPLSTFSCIVTEPYLGPPIETTSQGQILIKNKRATPEIVRNIQKGLGKLYIGCLKAWHPLLIRKGRVVIALPRFRLFNTSSDAGVKNVIDRCENLGYTLVAGPLKYSRQHAVVERQIYVLQKR